MKGYQSSMPLFDHPSSGKAVEPVDPSVLGSDRPRLTSASLRILARLKEGPALSYQLLTVGGVRYGARLHDLRKAGVIWKAEHVEGSAWRYELIQCPDNL